MVSDVASPGRLPWLSSVPEVPPDVYDEAYERETEPEDLFIFFSRFLIALFWCVSTERAGGVGENSQHVPLSLNVFSQT